jgi:hypothetical protein
MSFIEKAPETGSGRPAVVIVLIMAFILATLGSAVLSQEVKDQEPAKPRFHSTDLTVTDTKTGLVWVKNANLAERQFSWAGAFSDLDVIVNKERYAGFRDWRMPTKDELMSLVQVAHSQGYDGSTPDRSIAAGLASAGFQNVQDDAYWSSTENRYNANEASAVSMKDGKAAFADKDVYYNLWPVRSAR